MWDLPYVPLVQLCTLVTTHYRTPLLSIEHPRCRLSILAVPLANMAQQVPLFQAPAQAVKCNGLLFDME